MLRKDLDRLPESTRKVLRKVNDNALYGLIDGRLVRGSKLTEKDREDNGFEPKPIKDKAQSSPPHTTVYRDEETRAPAPTPTSPSGSSLPQEAPSPGSIPPKEAPQHPSARVNNGASSADRNSNPPTVLPPQEAEQSATPENLGVTSWQGVGRFGDKLEETCLHTDILLKGLKDQEAVTPIQSLVTFIMHCADIDTELNEKGPIFGLPPIDADQLVKLIRIYKLTELVDSYSRIGATDPQGRDVMNSVIRPAIKLARYLDDQALDSESNIAQDLIKSANDNLLKVAQMLSGMTIAGQQVSEEAFLGFIEVIKYHFEGIGSSVMQNLRYLRVMIGFIAIHQDEIDQTRDTILTVREVYDHVGAMQRSAMPAKVLHSILEEYRGYDHALHKVPLELVQLFDSRLIQFCLDVQHADPKLTRRWFGEMADIFDFIDRLSCGGQDAFEGRSSEVLTALAGVAEEDTARIGHANFVLDFNGRKVMGTIIGIPVTGAELKVLADGSITNLVVRLAQDEQLRPEIITTGEVADKDPLLVPVGASKEFREVYGKEYIDSLGELRDYIGLDRAGQSYINAIAMQEKIQSALRSGLSKIEEGLGELWRKIKEAFPPEGDKPPNQGPEGPEPPGIPNPTPNGGGDGPSRRPEIFGGEPLGDIIKKALNTVVEKAEDIIHGVHDAAGKAAEIAKNALDDAAGFAGYLAKGAVGVISGGVGGIGDAISSVANKIADALGSLSSEGGGDSGGGGGYGNGDGDGDWPEGKPPTDGGGDWPAGEPPTDGGGDWPAGEPPTDGGGFPPEEPPEEPPVGGGGFPPEDPPLDGEDPDPEDDGDDGGDAGEREKRLGKRTKPKRRTDGNPPVYDPPDAGGRDIDGGTGAEEPENPKGDGAPADTQEGQSQGDRTPDFRPIEPNNTGHEEPEQGQTIGSTSPQQTGTADAGSSETNLGTESPPSVGEETPSLQSDKDSPASPSEPEIKEGASSSAQAEDQPPTRVDEADDDEAIEDGGSKTEEGVGDDNTQDPASELEPNTDGEIIVEDKSSSGAINLRRSQSRRTYPLDELLNNLDPETKRMLGFDL